MEIFTDSEEGKFTTEPISTPHPTWAENKSKTNISQTNPDLTSALTLLNTTTCNPDHLFVGLYV